MQSVRYILFWENNRQLKKRKKNLHSVNTSLDSDPGIVHVASDVGEDLGLETQLADGLTVLSRLLRSARAGELDLYRI